MTTESKTFQKSKKRKAQYTLTYQYTMKAVLAGSCLHKEIKEISYQQLNSTSALEQKESNTQEEQTPGNNHTHSWNQSITKRIKLKNQQNQELLL